MTVNLSGAFSAPKEDEFHVLVDSGRLTYELKPRRWGPGWEAVQLKVVASAFYARIDDDDHRIDLVGLLGGEGGVRRVIGLAGVHMGSVVDQHSFDLAALLEDARARLGSNDDGDPTWGTFSTRLNVAAFLVAGIGALFPGSDVVFDTEGGTEGDNERCIEMLGANSVFSPNC